jgi:ABC-type transport system substrate-binding protein
VAILSDMTTRNVWALYGPEASFWNFAIQGGYWPTLYTYSPQRFDLIPYVAESFATPLQAEGDLWVSTVTLKQGVEWTDGTPVTAEDVAFTANTALAFQLGGNWGQYDGNYLQGAEAVDSRTVQFLYHTKPGMARHQFGALIGPIVNRAFWEPKLADAVAALEELEAPDPEDEEAVETYADALARVQRMLYRLDAEGEPTSGDWILNQWQQDQEVENVANADAYFRGSVVEEYANGAYREHKEGVYDFAIYGDPLGDLSLTFVRGPHFGSVRYTVTDRDGALEALEAGEVDFAINPSGWGLDLEQRMADQTDITVVSNPSNGFRYLAFNFDQAPMDDLVLRQAINCVIDKQFLTQDVMQGQAIPVHTVVPEGNGFWHNPDVPRPCADLTTEERVAWAVDQLKEAGYTWDVEPVWDERMGGGVVWGEGLRLPDGDAFPQITLLAPDSGSDPLRGTVMLHIQEWIAQLGIPVESETVAADEMLATVLEEDDWHMYALAWSLSGIFPDYVCDLFYPGNEFNTPGYANEDFETACDAFYDATDLETAQGLVFELQEILATDLPYVYLFTTPIVDAYRNDTVDFPYTEVLGGLSGSYGLPSEARPAE